MTTAPDPTPSLAEYRRLDAEDDNTFWRLSSGDHQNLLEEAIEEIDRLRAELEVVTVEAGNQCREAAARTVRAETERDEAWSSYRRVNAELRDTVADRDALDAKITAVREIVQEAVDRMEPASWIDALRAALGETGGTDER